MKRLVIPCTLFALAASVAWAGVVIEMEVSDKDTGSTAAIDTLYVEGTMLRMDPHVSSKNQNMSMIFRDDAMWILDHDKRRCQTIDKEGVASLGAQLGEAMKGLEAQMAQLPPEQRAMMEKMMKGKMPDGMGQDAPPRRVEKGALETVGAYRCTVHTLYSGDEKVWEVCAADSSAVNGGDEMMEAFRALSAFAEGLRESVKQLPSAQLIDTLFAEMQQVDGVPIRVRSYSNGTLQSESTMKSVTRRDIADDTFAVPKDYEVIDLANEIEKSR